MAKGKNKAFLELQSRGAKKSDTKSLDFCASRESNAGPIDGNDGFYH